MTPARTAQALPWPVGSLLHGIGAINVNGGALRRQLLYRQRDTRASTEVDYADTLARSDEVRRFRGAN